MSYLSGAEVNAFVSLSVQFREILNFLFASSRVFQFYA